MAMLNNQMVSIGFQPSFWCCRISQSSTVSPAYLQHISRCSCARKPCRAKPSSAHSSSISWSDSTDESWRKHRSVDWSKGKITGKTQYLMVTWENRWNIYSFSMFFPWGGKKQNIAEPVPTAFHHISPVFVAAWLSKRLMSIVRLGWLGHLHSVASGPTSV